MSIGLLTSLLGCVGRPGADEPARQRRAARRWRGAGVRAGGGRRGPAGGGGRRARSARDVAGADLRTVRARQARQSR